MDRKLVSIIIPVYNVESYLRKCIESILSQSYKNLQIILVDDGSSDSSGKICEEYSKKDKRIIVVHKENGGLSDARNCGLKYANGEYLTFVDSDDWVDQNYIKYLVELKEKYNTEISICEFKYITENGEIINKYFGDNRELVLSHKESVKELALSRYFSTSAWGKLYDTQLFDNLEFPYKRLYEDIPVTYKLFLDGHTVSFGACPLYFYLYRNGAISKKKFTKNRMDAIYFVEDAMKKMVKKYPEYKNLSYIRLFNTYFNTYLCLDDNADSSIYKSQIKHKLLEYRRKVIFNKNSTMKMKIKAFLCVLDYRLLEKMF